MSPAKNKGLKEKANAETASNISADVSETSNRSQKKGRGKKAQDKVEEVTEAENNIEKIEESKKEEDSKEIVDVEMTEPKEVENGEKEGEDVKDLVDGNTDQLSGDMEKMEVDEKQEEKKEEDDKPASKNKRRAAAKKGANSKNKTEKEEEDAEVHEESEEIEKEAKKPTRGKKNSKVDVAKEDEEAPAKTRQTRQKKNDEDKKVETPRATRSSRATEEAKKAEMPKSKRGSKKVEVEEDEDEEEEEEEEEEVVPKTKKNDKKAAASKKSVQTTKAEESTKTRNNKKQETEESKKSSKKAELNKKEVDEPKKDAVTTNNRKRKADADSPEKQAKKTKRSYEGPSVLIKFEMSGVVLSMGDGDVGQCGLGADVLEVSRPKKVDLGDDKIIQVAAGGMHSLCLTKNGEIYSFGCNDEATLGRATAEEEDCFVPGKVEGIEGKVVQVAAGDSHCAALTESGQVYIWGAFRDINGLIGINPDEESEENRRKPSQKRRQESGKEMGKSEKIMKPAKILQKIKIIKIASGSSHVLCLSDKGDMYSLGASDFGQLGRVPEKFSVRGGRFGLDTILDAKLVRFQGKRHKCIDIWAGAYVSFARTIDGEILSWGLNNYHQLGFPDTEKRMFPEIVACFDKNLDWKDIACAEHHTLALDNHGKVYCMGRKEYGRLGLGPVESLDHVNTLTPIDTLVNKKCISIGCGSSVSFAVVNDGTIYGWGMGSTKQLGTGDDEDDVFVPTPIKGKQLDNLKGIMAVAGGMHTLILASDKN